MSRVSVVIPVCRSGGADRLLVDLRRQTRPPDEIVVVADGDVEVFSYGIDDTNTKVVQIDLPARVPSYRPATVMNIGIAAAEGDVIIVAHDFTHLETDWIEKHLALLEGHSFATCMPCMHVEHDWDAHDFGFMGRSGHNYEVTPDTVYRMHPVGGSSLSFRTPDFHALGGFDERFDGKHGYTDSDFAVRLARLRGSGIHHTAVKVCRWIVGATPRAEEWRELDFRQIADQPGRVKATRPYSNTRIGAWDIPGWFADEEADAIVRVQPTSLLELGTWLGHSSGLIAERCPALPITTVDAYKTDGSNARVLDGAVRDGHFSDGRPTGDPAVLAAKFLFKYGNVKPIVSDSIEAASKIAGDFDVLFVDSEHTAERITAELAAWRYRVKRWIFFHDGKNAGEFEADVQKAAATLEPEWERVPSAEAGSLLAYRRRES